MSNSVGPTGRTLQSIAQILGASERNNRRDGLTAGLMFHGDEILQVVEGARVDIDRMLKRVEEDPRHSKLTVIEDRPVMHRRFRLPIEFCQSDARCVERTTCGRSLRDLTAVELEQVMRDCSLKAA